MRYRATPSAGFLMVVIGTLAGCGGDVALRDSPAADVAEVAKRVAADGAGFAVAAPAPAGQEPSVEQATAGTVNLPDRMLIRTGQVSIRVDSLEVAIRRVTELALATGGYVANSSLQTGEHAPRSATLEIKLPANRYQDAFDRMGAIGKVTSATTSTQDVGEEYVDVTARTANAKRLEERLVSLLATRAGRLEEVLGVERELARVRQEIERYEGRLRYLERQVAMSTLSVTVFEPGPLVGSPGENVIIDAFKRAWRNFVAVVAAGIAFLGIAVPVGVVALVAWLAVRAWRRRFRAPAGR